MKDAQTVSALILMAVLGFLIGTALMAERERDSKSRIQHLQTNGRHLVEMIISLKADRDRLKKELDAVRKQIRELEPQPPERESVTPRLQFQLSDLAQPTRKPVDGKRLRSGSPIRVRAFSRSARTTTSSSNHAAP